MRYNAKKSTMVAQHKMGINGWCWVVPQVRSSQSKLFRPTRATVLYYTVLLSQLTRVPVNLGPRSLLYCCTRYPSRMNNQHGDWVCRLSTGRNDFLMWRAHTQPKARIVGRLRLVDNDARAQPPPLPAQAFLTIFSIVDCHLLKKRKSGGPHTAWPQPKRRLHTCLLYTSPSPRD